MHRCRYGSVIPQTNKEFWQTKRVGNAARDKRNQKALKKLGWQILIVWECQTKKPETIMNKIITFLEK
jgi:DNA mismatch endonuclease, patch repair protein